METFFHSFSGFLNRKSLLTTLVAGGLFLLTATKGLSQECTITLFSAIGTENQTVCVNTPIVDIIYETTIATGADVTGLPDGVTGQWVDNVVTISGAPSEPGFFNYTITLTGSCGPVYTNGSITISGSAPAFTSCPSPIIAQIPALGECSAIIEYLSQVAVTGSPEPVLTYLFSGVTTGSGSGTGSGSAFSLGQTQVEITATNECSSVTCSFSILVNTPPVADAGGPYQICLGNGVTLDASGSYEPDNSCGDDINYWGWDLNNDGVDDIAESIENPSTKFLPWVSLNAYGLVTGENPLRLTVKDIYNVSHVVYTTLTINETTTPFASNNGPVLIGNVLSLYASTINGATYSWTGPESFASTEQNPVVSTSATKAMEGIYNVTAVVNNCTSAIATTNVIVNTAPVITQGESVSITCSEDNSPTSFSLTLNATDAENNTLEWSIKTIAAHGTATASGTGSSKEIGYTPEVNWFGTDVFEVKVVDSMTGSDSIKVNVTVVPVADNPTITPSGTNEDTQTTSGLVITRNANDGAEITHFKITNIQNGKLYLYNGTTQIFVGSFITAAQGTAGLKFTPSLNSTVNGRFDITAGISNTDAGLGGGTVTATITVNAVNDAPALSGLEGTTLIFTENQLAVPISSSIIITDIDDMTMEEGSVTITGNYLNGEDVLLFNNSSKITGSWDPSTGKMTLTRIGTESPTLTEWQHAFNDVKYHNISENPSILTRTLNLEINDGDIASNSITRDITLIPVNDAPIITLPISDQIFDEYFGSSNISLNGLFSDPENEPLTYYASSSNESVVTVSVTGTILTITEAGQGTAMVTITADDGDLNVNDNFNVTVNDVVTLPDGWNINPPDFSQSGLVIAEVSIDFIPVESGFLAAFKGEECRGIVDTLYIKSTDRYLFGLMCYSNPSTGDTLEFKYYDPAKDKVYKMDTTVVFTQDMVIGSFLKPVGMNNTIDYSVSFPVGWSWFSINAVMDNMLLNKVLTKGISDGDLIKDQVSFSSYFKTLGGWIGSLTQLQPKKLYKVQIHNSCNLNFSGTPVNTASTPITLVKGWNWIGYLPQTSLAINTALATLSPVLTDNIKNQSSFAEYIPDLGWIGGLSTLRPTEGYMIKVANPGTLVYPFVSSGKGSEAFSEEKEDYFNPSEFEYNGSVSARIIVDGIPTYHENDLLFAIVDNQIRGIAKSIYIEKLDYNLFPLMIHSNSSYGEKIEFRYYDSLNERYYKCDETVIFEKDMIVANALNPFRLNVISNQVTEIDNVNLKVGLRLFPNPFDEVLNIEYELPGSENVSIIVYDPSGKDVRTLVDQKQESGHYSIQWIPDEEPNGMYFVKFNAGDILLVKKVIFIP